MAQLLRRYLSRASGRRSTALSHTGQSEVKRALTTYFTEISYCSCSLGQDIMALPFIPGNSFNKNLGKTKYHKSHHFDIYCHDNRIYVGDPKPGIGGEPRLGQKLPPLFSRIPKGEGSNLPAWVAFDRQVLSFDAYYQVAIVERPEQYRVAKSKIYFYLEDDSIQVVENRIKDTGLPHGTIIHRHRIPKPRPNDDKFFTVEDFNVGAEVELHGKVFKIVDCDEFTRNFLQKLGVRVEMPEPIPEDPFMKDRKAIQDSSLNPYRPYEKYDTFKQFLDHDRHVLRFYCLWDDTESLYGDMRQLTLHYYLADDTIDIKEVLPPNCGRDGGSFLKRMRVPKMLTPVPLPGAMTQRTVLNVVESISQDLFYILDNLRLNSDKTVYIKDTDLTVGSVVNILGRKIVLCDCDEFTKEYYRTKYGITEFSPLKIQEEQGPVQERQLPPYNSFGGEEDTGYHCRGKIQYREPIKNIMQLMELDRCGFESNILRFLAHFESPKPIDKDRLFIISYYLVDDTITVFEPPVKNSGFSGGKFIERGRIKKPNQSRFAVKFPEYFRCQDLYVGATLDFNKHKFIIIDADEFTLNYMEKNTEQFLMSDVERILKKVRQSVNEKMEEVRAFKDQQDPAHKGAVSYMQFRGLVKKIVPMLTEQEVLTLARKFENKMQLALDTQQVMALVQEELHKSSYDGFDDMLTNLLNLDKNKTGFISSKIMRNILLASRVPVPEDLLGTLLEAAPANENGEIDYTELLKQMNWRSFPLPPPHKQATMAETCWQNKRLGDIQYSAFLEAVIL